MEEIHQDPTNCRENVFPVEKLTQIAKYCDCNEVSCSCNGFFAMDISETACIICQHSLYSHISYPSSLSTEEMEKFYNLSLDLDILNSTTQQDAIKEQMYSAISNVIKKCLINISMNDLTDIFNLYQPFPSPTLRQFVDETAQSLEHANSSTNLNRLMTLILLSKIFNQWNIPSPLNFTDDSIEGINMKSLNSMYQRWILHVEIPSLCSSFPKLQFSDITDLNDLHIVSKIFKSQIMNCISYHFPIFPTPLDIMFSNVPEILEIIESHESKKSSLSSRLKDFVNADESENVESFIDIPQKSDETCEDSVISEPSQLDLEMVINAALPEWLHPIIIPFTENHKNRIYSNLKQKHPYSYLFSMMERIPLNKSTLSIPSYFESICEKSRISGPLMEEKMGEIQFKVIRNSISSTSTPSSINTSILLLQVSKLIFSNIPEMSQSYIRKLVFDTKHRSGVLIKNNMVIATICFRMFLKADISEIVFVSVKSSEQVKGYGAYIMNRLKDYHNKMNCPHLITCADKNAVGYFKKLGFSENLQLPWEHVSRYIKTYENVTIMHCPIFPNVCHTRMLEELGAQKTLIQSAGTRLILRSAQIHPGFDDPTPISIDQIPGFENTFWMKQPCNLSDESNLNKILSKMLKSLKSHDCAWPFLQSVDPNDAPDYYEVITQPMDFEKIASKLKSNRYSLFDEFQEDVLLIIRNCKLYNNYETVYFSCAHQMEMFFYHLKIEVLREFQ